MSEQKAHGCASEAFPGEFSGGGWAGEMEALGWGGFDRWRIRRPMMSQEPT